MDEYQVVEFDANGNRFIISGLGKNKNKWDSTYSRSQAYYHKKILSKKYPNSIFKIEKLN